MSDNRSALQLKRTLHPHPTFEEYGITPAPPRHEATDQEISALASEILSVFGGVSAIRSAGLQEAAGKQNRVRILLNGSVRPDLARLEAIRNSKLIDRILVGNKVNDVIFVFAQKQDALKVLTILNAAVAEKSASDAAIRAARQKAEQMRAAKEAAEKERIRQEQARRSKMAEQEAAEKERIRQEQARRAKTATQEAARQRNIAQYTYVPASLKSAGSKVRKDDVNGLVTTLVERAGGKGNISRVSRSGHSITLKHKNEAPQRLLSWVHPAFSYIKNVSTSEIKSGKPVPVYKTELCFKNGEAAFLAHGKICKAAGRITSAQLLWSFVFSIIILFLVFGDLFGYYYADTEFVLLVVFLIFPVTLLVIGLMHLTHNTPLTGAIVFTLGMIIQEIVLGVFPASDHIQTYISIPLGCLLVFSAIEAIAFAVLRILARKK